MKPAASVLLTLTQSTSFHEGLRLAAVGTWLSKTLSRGHRLASLAIILCCCGCAQSLFNQTAMETRVIEQFADAINEENETALRRISSSRFEDKALQSDDVLRDLRVMHLPTGKLTVVEVKDVEKGRREVIVKEESGGKYQFQLVNDPKKQYWVVDDVVVRQRTKGTQVTKSTTEVMDLLVTLRQFLKVWETGSREEIFAMTSPELTAALQPLPDEWLKALTARIASTYEDGMARKPEANMNEGEAVVKLPAKNGHLLMKIVKNDDGWFVDDVEAHNHREDNHPGSIRRQASAINAVNAFLTAYAAEDHETLEMITTHKLYSESLKLADLSMIKLPKPSEVPAQFDMRTYENLLTFMIPAGREIVRLDLQEEKDTGQPSASGGSFLVRDVTLYEKATQKQQALSAVFTAPTHASLFLKALKERNHQMLTQISSKDFSKGTWQRLSPELMKTLPLPDFPVDGLRLTDSQSFAQTTELEFETADGSVLTCRLSSHNGVLKIDDVQYPNEVGQVTSLKTRLNLAIPVIEFATAWKNNDMELLQKSCSADFNRLVWSHLDSVPAQFSNLSHDLMAPVSDTRVTQERATVKFQNANFNLVAQLVMEHGYWVMDEVQSEPTPGQFVGVRKRLRSQIAEEMLSGSYSTILSSSGHEVISPVKRSTPKSNFIDNGFTAAETPSAVRQASGPFSSDDPNTVNQALYKRYVDEESDKAPSTRVTPAVLTRDVTDQQFAQQPNDGKISNASHRQPPAASSSGMAVFGPQAEQIAQAMTTPVAAASQPESVDFGTEPGARERKPGSEEGVMYFGPKRETAQLTQPTENVGSPASPRSLRDRNIRQPSDMPISIN